MPRYLRPTAPIASSALLTGDPKRAMDLAAAVTEGPLMSNLARGLWGYHGVVPGGDQLTIQSTGIGGPSAAAVVADLAEHGVTRAIRIGTCSALDGLELGAVVVVENAVAADGAGSVFAGGLPIAADPTLTAALATTFGREPSTIASVTLPVSTIEPELAAGSGAVATDLSTAAVLGASAQAGVASGAVVLVQEAPGAMLDDQALDAAMLEAGRLAVDALAAAV